MSFINTTYTRVTSSSAYARVKEWARPVAAACAALIAAAIAGVAADAVALTLTSLAVTLTGSFFFSYLVWLLCTVLGFAAVAGAAVATARVVLNADYEALGNKVRGSLESVRTRRFARAA